MPDQAGEGEDAHGALGGDGDGGGDRPLNTQSSLGPLVSTRKRTPNPAVPPTHIVRPTARVPVAPLLQDPAHAPAPAVPASLPGSALGSRVPSPAAT